MKRFISAALLVLLLAVTFAPQPVAAQTTCGDTFTVQRGDYLTLIARKCGTTVSKLLQLNPAITNWNIIYPGQVLRLTGEVPQPPASGTTNDSVYIVRYGDTLRIISNKFGISIQRIVELNPSITNINRIEVGQVIRLSGTAPAPQPTQVPTGGSVYIAQRGDSLRIIADRYRTTIPAILAANPEISNPNIIYVGQRIRIPAAGTTAAAPVVYISPDSGTPGSKVMLVADKFPINVNVDIVIKKDGESTGTIIDSKTDASGYIRQEVTIPAAAKAGEKWVVRVTTTDLTKPVDRTSNVFLVK